VPAQLDFTSRSPVDPDAMADVIPIIEEIRTRGEPALLEHSSRLGDIEPGNPITLGPVDLEAAFGRLPGEQQSLLRRVAGRVEHFARAQKDALTDVRLPVTGGTAGHRWIPVESVGAYAPGGRHPLPSSVLMTVIPARVAGVKRVWSASPRPSDVTLGAAYVAGAEGVLAVGGAQAIAALAFGTVSPRCDLIVGPGNKWVTAAKKYLYGEVGIDGLAGPSEILVIADEHADPVLVAADLLAQAEHDTDSIPSLVTTSAAVADAVEDALEQQLVDLPTADVARAGLENGFSVVVDDLAQAAEVSDQIAAEHLALHVADPETLTGRLRSYGSLFVGARGAETFADYGVGPNHVLPTGGSARFQSGLSVMTFLRAPTWLRLEEPALLVHDTALLARVEGLEAHARAALARA
jgi:phosphoribosyl-ATP pyrophosphohydrolase/phosphoribosyl-AMP cyclohydrolase/histidinol dehydrogenase